MKAISRGGEEILTATRKCDQCGNILYEIEVNKSWYWIKIGKERTSVLTIDCSNREKPIIRLLIRIECLNNGDKGKYGSIIWRCEEIFERDEGTGDFIWKEFKKMGCMT